MQKVTQHHYIVQISKANMPNSCWGGYHYHNIAVLRIDSNRDTVSSISERARGCQRIVEYWGRLHSKGKDTAFSRALEEAKTVARMHNTISALLRALPFESPETRLNVLHETLEMEPAKCPA